MANIIGSFECKTDTKGRFMFPTAFKNQLGDEFTRGFVIKRGIFRNCLELYPMAEWQRVSAKVTQLNWFRKKNVDFIRKFMAGIKIIEPDGVGRFVIPKDLVRFAGITREIVLASYQNMIEIWDKEEYEKVVDYEPDDFAKLAEEVMGDSETE